MAGRTWQISGEYMESCNCDYLCPCIYTNPQEGATQDDCTAALVFRIAEGEASGVRLDGLGFALLLRTGKVMADGNWLLGCVVDERADAAQRAALAAIVGGEAGGTPGMIRRAMVGDFRGVEFRAMTFGADGLKRSVSIPGVLEFDIAGVASRNGSGEPIWLDNVSHPAGRRLALARTQRYRVEGFGLDLEMIGKGNNGHFAPFAWAGAWPDAAAGA